mmetsp:Transcript_23384/g.51325  ORF Transcript_23384/g.51325 Transcript_23384/m.51325 type:complete len:279 (+) Transcript_23384:161-997(+)
MHGWISGQTLNMQPSHACMQAALTLPTNFIHAWPTSCMRSLSCLVWAVPLSAVCIVTLVCYVTTPSRHDLLVRPGHEQPHQLIAPAPHPNEMHERCMKYRTSNEQKLCSEAASSVGTTVRKASHAAYDAALSVIIHRKNETPQQARLQVLLNGLHQSCLGDSADDGIHLLASLEHHHGGDAPNAIISSSVRAFVRVQLHTLQLVLVFNSKLIDDRGNHAARAAPRCPKIHQHRGGALQHQFAEGVIVNLRNGTGSHGTPAGQGASWPNPRCKSPATSN